MSASVKAPAGKKGVGHRAHPIIALLNRIRIGLGIPIETLEEKRLWERRGASSALMSSRDVTLWNAEVLANRFGFRLALTPMLPGEEPIWSPLDTDKVGSRIMAGLRRLKLEEVVKDIVMEMGWGYHYAVHPLVKAMAHALADRRITPAEIAKSELCPKAERIRDWLDGKATPSIENLEAVLNAGGLGFRIVPITEGDTVRYATMTPAGEDLSDLAPFTEASQF